MQHDKSRVGKEFAWNEVLRVKEWC